MNEILTAVLSKVKLSKAQREAIEVGTYSGSALVSVDWLNLKVGDDYEQRIVAKADPWKLLAATLSHLNGVTIESIAREAINADPSLVKSLKEQANTATAAIKATTWTRCKGKITAEAITVREAAFVEVTDSDAVAL